MTYNAVISVLQRHGVELELRARVHQEEPPSLSRVANGAVAVYRHVARDGNLAVVAAVEASCERDGTGRATGDVLDGSLCLDPRGHLHGGEVAASGLHRNVKPEAGSRRRGVHLSRVK